MEETSLLDWLSVKLQSKFEKREAGNIARLLIGEDGLNRTFKLDRSALSEQEGKQLDHWISRILEDEPIQYVLGKTYFYNLPLKIDSRALIPRPETEELVHWVLTDLKKDHNKKRVIDIGTGSGCIPLSIKKERPDLILTGIDVSPDALALCRQNAQLNQLDVSWIELDILNENKWKDFPETDVLISNPPYIPLSESHLMSKSTVAHEPELALFVNNNDPMLFYRKIARLAVEKMSPLSKIYVEINAFRKLEVMTTFQDAGLVNIMVEQDMQGKDRMIRAEVGPN